MVGSEFRLDSGFGQTSLPSHVLEKRNEWVFYSRTNKPIDEAAHCFSSAPIRQCNGRLWLDNNLDMQRIVYGPIPLLSPFRSVQLSEQPMQGAFACAILVSSGTMELNLTAPRQSGECIATISRVRDLFYTDK